MSLNDVLLTGPDLTNSLIGVLLRFRKERVALTADIEQMFFNFYVHEQHRDYLRFIWYKDNNPENELIEYRMRVHVFGNSPSPAVATLGLRKSACSNDTHNESCSSVCKFVRNNFYVDDGLVSLPDEDSAVNLIKNTQTTLKQEGNLRLNKLSSNNRNVLARFPKDDLAKDMNNIDFDSSNLQRSLGLHWNIKSDTFTYQVCTEIKPFTKRGILSTINSVFDPIGFVAKVLLGGKIILRKALLKDIGWDEELSQDVLTEWEKWRSSLKHLESLQIPRRYTEMSFIDSVKRELHIFSDASKEAIGSVAYLRILNANGESQQGFVMGKAKIAPSHGHTIPRLELCAAVLAVELASFILDHLHISVDSTHFYTDSQVVLGYIRNETRRFYVYVENRVDRIRKLSSPEQWNYISRRENPADQTTRPVNADKLSGSMWLKGPSIKQSNNISSKQMENFELIEPESDKEIRPIIHVAKTEISQTLGTTRFSKFSSFKRLVMAISKLKQFISSYSKSVKTHSRVDLYQKSEKFVLKEVQRELYSKEIE